MSSPETGNIRSATGKQLATTSRIIKMAKKSIILIEQIKNRTLQFVIFKPLTYCFKETIGFDVKASFASRP